MAVRSDALIGHLERTASILPAAANMSVCLWVRAYGVTPAPGSYRVFYAQIDAPGTYAQYAGLYSELGTNDVAVSGDNGGGFQATAYHATTLGTWYHLAWTQTGTTQRFYANGVLIGSCTLNRAAVTVGVEYLLNDTFATGDVDVAFVRQWTTALSAAQIQAEMVSAVAVHATNLYMDCPLLDDLLDDSGLAHDWTAVGSTSFVAGPDPANSLPSAATVFTSVPYSTTVTLTPPFTTWYRYSPTVDGVIGMWGYSATETPLMEVFSPDASTSYLQFNDLASTFNVPVQVSTYAGVDYYFKLTPSVFPSTASLAISAVAAPVESVPAGSFLINDDASGYPAAFLSSASSRVLRFQQNIVSGEGGDVASTTGVILLEDEPNGQLVLYNEDLTGTTATLAFGPGTGGQQVRVRANQTSQTFYAGQRNYTNNPVFKAITAAGVMTTLTTLSAHGVTAFAVNDDASIVYLSGSPLLTSSNVRQWNVAGSAFGADIAAAVANYRVTDMLWLEDGTLLVMYVKTFSPGDIRVINYSAAGATLHTYTLATAVTIPVVSSGYRLAFALDSPTSFWAWFHVTDGGINDQGVSRIQNVVVATGVVSTTIDYYEYELGIYSASPSATPGSRFGPSASCPFIVLRGSTTEALATTEYLIRRERIFPVISKEQHRLFFSKLQLYFEAGVGLSSGQGSDPIVELDWSDDGGHTWSNLHLIQTGKQGQYKWRAMKWNMGSARERLYRVAVTDPVQWTLMDAWLDFTEGLS